MTKEEYAMEKEHLQGMYSKNKITLEEFKEKITKLGRDRWGDRYDKIPKIDTGYDQFREEEEEKDYVSYTFENILNMYCGTTEFQEEVYSDYAGTYAHDVEGLDDDFINDVLDGDPDAYWNID